MFMYAIGCDHVSFVIDNCCTVDALGFDILVLWIWNWK